MDSRSSVQRHPHASSSRQFAALLHKNFLLQTRSRKTILGLGGWGALVVQVLLPSLFFALMCIPKYYIKPVHHDKQLSIPLPDLESRWWSGPNPYSGPALDFNISGGLAHIVLTPNTPAVQALSRVLARALACPAVPLKYSCPPNVPPNSFHCLFVLSGAPPQCKEPDSCMSDEACWGHLLTPQAPPAPRDPSSDPEPTPLAPLAPITILPTEAAAVSLVLERPARIDAVLVFGPGSGSTEPPAPAMDTGLGGAANEQSLGVTATDTGSSQHAGLAERALGLKSGLILETLHSSGPGQSVGGEKRRQLQKWLERLFEAGDSFGGPPVEMEIEDWDESDEEGQGGAQAKQQHEQQHEQQEQQQGEERHKQQVEQHSDAVNSSVDGNTVQERLESAYWGRSQPHPAPSYSPGPGLAADLMRYTLRMNHTDTPITRLLLDSFDIVPSRENALSLYQRYWFFANLQHVINRCVLGMRAAELRDTLPSPPPAPPPPSPLPPGAPVPAPGPPIPAATPDASPTAAPSPGPPSETHPSLPAAGLGQASIKGSGSRRRVLDTLHVQARPFLTMNSVSAGAQANSAQSDATHTAGTQRTSGAGSVFGTSNGWQAGSSAPAGVDAGGSAGGSAGASPAPVGAANTGGSRAAGTSGGGAEAGAYEQARPVPLLLSVKPFPWPAVDQDMGSAVAAVFFNLLMVYAFLSPARGVVGGIVREKELRLREGMRLMGLGDAAYWGSWFLTHWTSLMASGVLCALIGLYTFPHTAFTLMITFFALFTAALTSFSYFLATLFSTSRVAGAGAQLLYALAMLPGFLAPSFAPYAGTSWFLCCLLPPGAASLWAACLINWELVSQGLTWNTSTLPVAQGSSFCAASVLHILMFDILLYTLLAWYLDKVLPTSPSQREPPLFFLKYFKRRPASKVQAPALPQAVALSSHAPTPGAPSAAALTTSPVPPGSPLNHDGSPQQGVGAAGIRAVGLVKVFPGPGGTQVRALDGAGLSVKPGSITVLLGHNGAGKTTLISILTGLEGATQGHAYVNGMDVATDMATIRQDLGVCPQFDVLWPELSVTEHLQLHGAIKGFTGASLKQVVAASVAAVGLEGSAEQLAGDLSGGQRRKLSLAAALIGGPSCVLVDEPTSGTDPYTRRFTWDLLRAVRNGSGPGMGSAVLLTTHSMEEAEALADHVVIMAQGRVVAEGSPQELRSLFGEGYTFTLVSPIDAPGHTSAAPQAAAASPDGLGHTQDERLLRLLRDHVPGTVPLGRQGAQVAFRTPRDATPAFPGLLRELDAIVAATNNPPTADPASDSHPQADVCISSYGLSVTTLEEVFLRVTEAADGVTKGAANGPGSNGPNVPPTLPALTRSAAVSRTPFARITKWRLVRQQLHALLVKRALCARRERLTLLTQLLVPLALVALALWAADLSLRSPDAPPLVCVRDIVLMGAPSVMGATAAVRAEAGWQEWLKGYAQAYVDSGTDQVWRAGPLNGTIEGYLLDTWHAGRPAYDAFVMQQMPAPLAWITGGSGDMLKGVVLVNQSAVHAIPGALNQVAESALQFLESAVPLTTAANEVASTMAAADLPRMQVTNHPLPTLPTEPLVRVQQDAGGLLLVVCLTMASSLMSASVAVHLVRERASKAKHVQLVSGARPLLFWTANWIWDYLQYSVTAVGIIVLVAAYHLPQYTGTRLWAVAGLLGGFGFAGLALTFLLQGLFTDEMLALQRLNTGYFLVGYLGFVITWIIDLILIFTQPAALRATNVWVKFLFRLLSPHFCFSKGVFDISQTYRSRLPIPGPRETNPFAWSVWGSPMAHMAGQAVFYFTLVVLLDSGVMWGAVHRMSLCLAWVSHRVTGLFKRRSHPAIVDDESLTVALLEQGQYRAPHASHVGGAGGTAVDSSLEDHDVAVEREAVQSGAKAATSKVLLDGVTKTYHMGPLAALRGAHDPRAIRAVRGLWLGVPQGECFGLLGVNGAGKTTTFGMLTGEIRPDTGDAWVCGFSVTSHLSDARHNLGYCPQFESLLVLMTPKEVLSLYARLRGVPPHAEKPVVTDLLRRLGLESAANRQCGTLSGGNKRKLALGVALVGEPPVTLCDEPSTGVDPGARRSMWSLLKSDVMGEGHSLVLTSHSMEECDALCDRLVIMVAGKAACLGSPQHLKARFGGGYLIDLRCVSEDAVKRVISELQRGPCPDAVLAEVHGTQATVAIPRADAASALPGLFEWLEGQKRILDDLGQAWNGGPGAAAAAPPGSTNAAAGATIPSSSATPGPAASTARLSSEGPVSDPAGTGAKAQLKVPEKAAKDEPALVPQEGLGRERLVVSYSVRQATLESVFLHMAHHTMNGSA